MRNLNHILSYEYTFLLSLISLFPGRYSSLDLFTYLLGFSFLFVLLAIDQMCVALFTHRVKQDINQLYSRYLEIIQLLLDHKDFHTVSYTIYNLIIE